MKYLIVFAVSFFLLSCGGSGHIILYNFNAPKYDVQKEILGVINKDSVYCVPKKWVELVRSSGDGLEYFHLYFKNKPEEMYEIGFADSASWVHSPTSCLSLEGSFDGNLWKYGVDLSNKEVARITKRFEDEILSKIKYTYNKSYHNW